MAIEVRWESQLEIATVKLQDVALAGYLVKKYLPLIVRDE